MDNEQWLILHSQDGAYGLNSAFNEGHLHDQETHSHKSGASYAREAVATS